jgi:hypothetical protein
MSAAVDHLYRYVGTSSLDTDTNRADGPRLSLATSGGAAPHPYFFEGRLTAPRVTALSLRALSHIVGTRFFVPPAMLGKILTAADPVITSGRGMLRFEGFSGCASAYARVDVTTEGVAGETLGLGTTNVDFHAPLRAALANVRDGDALSLSVGRDEVALTGGDRRLVERKVPLPVRWLKGFVEVQAYLARMTPFRELPRVEAMRFLRGLPRAKTQKHAVFLVPQGTGLRLAMTETDGALRTTALERLRVLEELSALARSLRIYGDPLGQSSAWELDFGPVRLTLVLSAEVWRGFSGEGQALVALAKREGVEDLVAGLRAKLRWEPSIDPRVVGPALGASGEEVTLALAVLGSRGLVGFDQREGGYFHRELPFDLDALGQLSPRLDSARELLAAGAVRRGTGADGWIVTSEGVEQRVDGVAPDGSGAGTSSVCSCVWFAKHGNTRGPCKHVLAVVLWHEDDDEEAGT